MNSFTIHGNLGQDPELKEVGQSEVAEFTIADKQYEGPERQSSTGWYRCQVWGARAHTIMEFFRKGAAVTIVGTLKQRKYQTKDGEDKIALDIRVNDFTLPLRASGDDRDERDDRRPAPRQESRGNDRDDDRGRDRRPAPARSGASPRSRGRDDEYDDGDVPF
jgi:single-strand DNA-binding protein